MPDVVIVSEIKGSDEESPGQLLNWPDPRPMIKVILQEDLSFN